MIKKFIGNEPSGEDGWVDVGKVPGRELRNSSWRIFMRYRENTEGWFDLKVFAEERVRHKANFWLSWNGERFAQRGDLYTMYKNFPAMMVRLKESLPRLTKVKKFMDEIKNS